MQTNLMPGSDIHAYMNQVCALDMLTQEQEYELAVRYKKHNDLDAAQTLIVHHLRYVVYLAKKFTGYGLPICDLIQQGNYGLMIAVQKFDPEQGVRLISYAVHSIKSEILNFIIRNKQIVISATTKAKRKLFFNLRKYTNADRWLTDQEITNIAVDLNVEERDIREMEQRMSVVDESFSPSELEDDEGNSRSELMNTIEDDTITIEHLVIKPQHDTQQSKLLSCAVQKLNDREQYIIQQRFLSYDKPKTLTMLAGELGVSAERVRQLELQTLKKLKVLMSS